MRYRSVILICFWMVFVVLLLAACTPSFLAGPALAELNASGDSSNVTNSSAGIEIPASTSLSTPCTPHWKCISSMARAYQLENCSFSQRETCSDSCLNDTCVKPQSGTCTSGFKCKGQHAVGYQLEDCSWTSVTKCDFGCSDAECSFAPNVTAESSGSAEEEPAAPVRAPGSIIKLGEVLNISVKGGYHTLRIYQLNPDYAQIELDGRHSDRLTPGQGFTFFNGIRVTVADIYFQSYAGGKQEVEYRME